MSSGTAVRTAAVIAALTLAGCDSGMFDFGPVLFGTSSSVSQLNDAEPTGTAFQRAQFKDYSYLAHSFGNDPSSDFATLADLYATKALDAAKGNDVAPETPRTSDEEDMRARLGRALGPGRAQAPADAARAQADYDCWLMNDTIPSSSKACRASLDSTLAQLESDVGLPSY